MKESVEPATLLAKAYKRTIVHLCAKYSPKQHSSDAYIYIYIYILKEKLHSYKHLPSLLGL